jgi:two-component system sensor histidine kinase ChiS
MTGKKLLLITTAVLLILIVVRIIWIIAIAPPNQPSIVNGQLDLQNWDFAKEPVINLDGQWEFYPYELLMSHASRTLDSRSEREFIQVPGQWNSFFPKEKSSHYGYGTYRLKVLVNPSDDQLYSMRLPSIFSSSAVFVNGHLVGKKGQPASTIDHYKNSTLPYSVSFSSDEPELDIVIHAANFLDNIRSGIAKSIKFGTEEAISQMTWFSIVMQLLVVIFLVIQAMYAFMLYMMGTRHKSIVYFTLLLIAMSFTVLLDDDRLLLNWLPINYEWSMRILVVAFVAASALLLALVISLLPEYSKFRVFRWFSFVSVLIAIIFIVMPFSFTMRIGFHYFFILIATLLVSIVLTMRSTVRGVQDVIFLFLAACVILLNGIGGVVKVIGGIQIGFYPVDYIVAFFIFSAYWFRSYLRISTQTKQLADKLLEADKQKDEFLANTSHELRNPLHGILNIAQTVLESNRTALSDKNVRNLELIVTVGRRMSFMLNDLLDLTRLKQKGIRLQTTAVSIQPIVAGVCEMLLFMTEGKAIRVINTVPESFPKVLADENRLIQILFNLLHNAMKYTNEGTITIKAHTHENRAFILVSDTGMGMDSEAQERIFQPYEQVDSSITAIGGGLGLGLSICRQLVELHGGVLEVSSTLNQGSTFTFSLPLYEPEAATSYMQDEQSVFEEIQLTEYSIASSIQSTESTKSTESMFSADRPRILAVDDDPINLNILLGILTLEYDEIVTVMSGKEALALLETKEWDLIIADVMMPSMSGYELTRMIRERFTISELPILLLTARSQVEDIEAGFRSGANDYVTKPVEATELRSRVRSLTGLRRSIRERLRMEAAWLQAQIQPHFLFNTLNAIAALSDMDTVRMRILLDVFGQYLHASFDFRNSDRVVPLEHELSLVRSYLYIEQERFENRLEVSWEVDETLILDIPPLSIQPLVENAVRHGIMKKPQGGRILIRITECDTFVEVTIEDNGVGIDEHTLRSILESQSRESSGIGLLNVDRRLKQIYGRGLHVHSVLDEGTIVSFRITQ